MPQMCENVGEAGRRANVTRPLTHSLDLGEEGLAMQATPCSVPDCIKPAEKRGWCGMHYYRWRVHGSTDKPVRSPRSPKAPTPCAVDGCDRRAKSRGLCTGHYSRLLRTGDIGPAELWNRQRSSCVADGCARLARAYGYCESHRSRVERYGDPLADVPLGHKPPLTYSGVHQQLRRLHGPAADHLCADCLGPAAEWAYDETDPAAVAADGRRFSRNVSHYLPLCIRCHRRFDHSGDNLRPPQRAPDQPTEPESTEESA